MAEEEIRELDDQQKTHQKKLPRLQHREKGDGKGKERKRYERNSPRRKHQAEQIRNNVQRSNTENG